ncbi:MAG: cysteine hydrolase [Myxococcales bacterium]|nr:cysteine hydrolase [Myxococcales bacterium]
MEQTVDWTRSALVIVDPQVDVLSQQSVIWDLVGEQVSQLDVVNKLVALRDQAEQSGVSVFYAWLEMSEADYASWQPRNGLQQLMADRRMMLRGRGARFVPPLEPTAHTVLLTPRRTPSTTATDLTLQLRQRGLDTIVVAGMVANLCVESHVRDATDAGYRAFVVEDAIATTDQATLDATLADFQLTATGRLRTDAVLASLQAETTRRANTNLPAA